MTGWVVYILRCSDDTFYTGITTDIERRVYEHNHSTVAAAYTRARRPVRLIYTETCESRSGAARREHQIRTLNRRQKEALIANGIATTD